jgi:linoleate 10R-lipoxygenase
MRAVLGDAIALVRGDRFYTTDFTRGCRLVFPHSSILISTAAANLTAWGFQDCVRDPHNGGFVS